MDGGHGRVPGRAASRRTSRQKRPALKRGGTTTVPPASSVDSVAAIRPWTWNSGMTQSADVVRRSAGNGSDDVAGRGHQVAVAQRHALGPAGGAAGVQHQGNVIGSGAATTPDRFLPH